MALEVFNITGTAITLAAGNPARVIPLSSAPPARGPGVNVTSELRGLTGGQYTALEAQRTGGGLKLIYEWTSDPEYAVGTLVIGGPAPAKHAPTHAGGSDPVTVSNGTTGATVNSGTASTTATDTAAALLLAISGTPALGVVDDTHLAVFADDAAAAFPGPFTNPDVPRTIVASFEAAWDGGDITIHGTNQFAAVTSEVLVANPGGTTVSLNAYATITAAEKNVVPGLVHKYVKLGRGDALGIPATTSGSIGILAVTGVTEAATFNSTYNTVLASVSTPNGARTYSVFVNALHTHTVTDAGHTHGVTDAGHTHGLTG